MAALRVAVVGPGAIGGVLAAWLARRADLDVTLCARTPFERLVVSVPGGDVVDAAPRVLADPALAAPVEWVVVATKAYDTVGARAWIEGLARAGTRVAIAQNGVEHLARFEGVVAREQMLPVVVELSAERTAPGRMRQRGPGKMVVPGGELGASFASLFAHSPIAVDQTADFTTAAWRKLVLNAAGVVQALTSRPARVVHGDEVGALARDIAAEAAAVGRAEGARLEAELPDAILARLRASAPDSMNSIAADRVAGRPMEVDARNGVVVRLGRKHGIPTPRNEMAVAILAGVAGASSPPSLDPASPMS